MIFSQRTFWKSVITIVLIMALMKVTGGGGFALVLPVALAAFIQKRTDVVLFWVLVSMTMLMGNHFLMPKNLVFMASNKLVFLLFGFIMLVSLVTHRKVRSVAPFGLLVPYLLFMIVPSSLGWSPVISYLKLLLFLMVYLALIGVANEVSLHSRSAMPVLRAMVFAVAAFVIVGSVLLIPFPGISQLTGEEYAQAIRRGAEVKSLFKGITWHSQSLGPMVAFLSIFIFADWTLCVQRFSWLHAVLLGLCPVLLYKTSSRTAMGAAIFGMAVVMFCMMRERGIAMRWQAKVKRVMFVVAALLLVAILASPSLRDSAARFILKTSKQVETRDVNAEDVLATRQFLIDQAMYHFRKSPMIGNGFQVSDEMQYLKTRSLKDILSAPVEKGVWTAAVLEEGGLIGMSLFLLFVIGASIQLYLSRSYMALSLLLTFLVINMGEFVMFSMSGVGGFLWTLIFIGASFDTLRLRDDKHYMDQQWFDNFGKM